MLDAIYIYKCPTYPTISRQDNATPPLPPPPSPLSPHSNPTPHKPFFLSFSLAFAAFSLL